MSKAATTARWSLPFVGGALVVALQTPPDTAASNAALWIEKVTGHLPDFPPWADVLGTAIGVLLIVAPVAFWAWKKWRSRKLLPDPPNVAEPEPAPLASRHAEILCALSRPLATVQEQTLTYGHRDLPSMLAAKLEAEALIAEIPYDEGTVRTVRDLLQACTIALEPHANAVAAREARNDVDRIAPGLFRQLHAGRPIDRRKVDLPEWCRAGDSALAKPTPGGPIEAIPSSPKPNEYNRAWNQSAAEEAGQTARVPFSEVIRLVVYASDWADEFEGCDYDGLVRRFGDPWKLVLREVCRPLTIGDLVAWGIRCERYKDPENGPTPIPASFWTRADFAPELMLADPSIGSAGNGELGLIYTDIMFDRDGVRRAWPFAQRDGNPSPFECIYEQWRAKWDAEHGR